MGGKGRGKGTPKGGKGTPWPGGPSTGWPSTDQPFPAGWEQWPQFQGEAAPPWDDPEQWYLPSEPPEARGFPRRPRAPAVGRWGAGPAAQGQASSGKGGGKGCASPQQKGGKGKAAPSQQPRWEQQRAQAAAENAADDSGLPWYFRATGELLRVGYPLNLKDGWPPDGPWSMRQLQQDAKDAGCRINVRARGAQHTFIMLTITGPVGCTKAWFHQVRMGTRLFKPETKLPRLSLAWVVPIVEGQLAETGEREEEAAPADDSDTDASDAGGAPRPRARVVLRTVDQLEADLRLRTLLMRERDRVPSLPSATPPASDKDEGEEAAPSPVPATPRAVAVFEVDLSESDVPLEEEAAPILGDPPMRLPPDLQHLYDAACGALEEAPCVVCYVRMCTLFVSLQYPNNTVGLPCTCLQSLCNTMEGMWTKHALQHGVVVEHWLQRPHRHKHASFRWCSVKIPPPKKQDDKWVPSLRTRNVITTFQKQELEGLSACICNDQWEC